MGMTFDQLSDEQLGVVLLNVRLKPAPHGKVVILLPSGKDVAADQATLRATLQRLLDEGRERPKRLKRRAVAARERIDQQMSFRLSLAEASCDTPAETVEDFFERDDAESLALTLNPDEAARVAGLAEQAGCSQTVALLRLLCDRHGALGPSADGRAVRIDELLDPPENLESAWNVVENAAVAREQVATWQRLLQTLSGMQKTVHASGLYAEVLDALRKNPRLTCKQFWDSAEAMGGAVNRDENNGRAVLLHEDDSEEGLTFGSLRRYFSRARKALKIKFQRSAT